LKKKEATLSGDFFFLGADSQIRTGEAPLRGGFALL
jgi:hypothetical protein